jgi:hypothetical protein
MVLAFPRGNFSREMRSKHFSFGTKENRVLELCPFFFWNFRRFGWAIWIFEIFLLLLFFLGEFGGGIKFGRGI